MRGVTTLVMVSALAPTVSSLTPATAADGPDYGPIAKAAFCVI